MKFEDINDNTIKISLTFEDLSDHDVKLSDFFQNQEAIEQLFYELVEELGLENRFTQTGMLTFQVQPNPKGVHLIVTEENFDETTNVDFDDEDSGDISEDPEEFEELMSGFYNKLNELGANMAAENGVKNYRSGSGVPNEVASEEEKPNPDFIFYVIRYQNALSLLTAVKNVQFTEELSELYRYDDDFYLVILDSRKKRGRIEVETSRARMAEYGELTIRTREFLQEYGKCLITSRALETLRKI